ncbi:hypothetical protein [Rappaport israeli]|uniref:hypothetical protein n=1 Tax=Rappaport israeli TaxID=1839807 RepID=UPI0009302DBA|nr:hypothetical protein [Rappaport israeli]
MTTVNKLTKMRLQPLAIAIYFAAQSVYAAPQSPFLSTPPHLIDIKSEVSKLTALPNILLQVDDSGSMSARIGRTTRMDILKEALFNLLNNYDPSNPNAKKDAQGRPLQMHWNMITLNGTASDRYGRYGSYNNYVPVAYVSRRYEYMTAAELRPYISRLYASGGTPSTQRYIHSAKTALEAMKYHCQKTIL